LTVLKNGRPHLQHFRGFLSFKEGPCYGRMVAPSFVRALPIDKLQERSEFHAALCRPWRQTASRGLLAEER
jgi:hypothetical protein